MAKSLPNNPETLPFLVVCNNKVNLEDQGKVLTMEGKKFAHQNGNMIFFESSTRENLNVE